MIVVIDGAAASALAVHRALKRQPIATPSALVNATALTPATVNKSLAHLERIGIVGEITNRQRGRVFSYRKHVEGLATELEARSDRAATPCANIRVTSQACPFTQ